MSASYSALVAEIAELIEVDPGELTPDSSLLDWGLDSIRLMTLVERFRERGASVGFADLAEEPTLRHYARLLQLSP